MKLSGIKLKVFDPEKSSINEIKKTAKETGDLEKLSKTDIKVLALAKENRLDIVSDDYNIQNVAEKIGINYISLFSSKITKLIRWGMYCNNCRRFCDRDACPKCGNQLVRKPAKEELINSKK